MSYKKCITLIFCLFTNTGFALQIGDQAPNFDSKTTLCNLNFYEWSKNHWVILFSHPGDFTPVCTTELASAALFQPEFKKRNVKVIALRLTQSKIILNGYQTSTATKICLIKRPQS